MRIAHITTVDMSLRFLLLPQLTALVDRDIEALGISALGPYVADLEARGIRHIALPGATRSVDPAADVRAMMELWRILRRERPDVLHAHTVKPGLYGRVIGRLAGVPAVLNTIHGLYATPDDPLIKRTVVYLLEALAARFSDAELVQSAEDFELVTRRRITRPDRTYMLGNGVDLRRFDPDRGSPHERHVVRASLGVDDDGFVIGTVGRLVAEKGYHELFEAVRGLGDRFVLVVVGPHEPDKADAIDEATIAAARDNGVVFVGMREDVDVLYRAMDLFVLPSHREGFPRSAMEAAASGLPLIVTDIRGCREVVDDAVNGLLVPVRDPDALRAAILRIAGDDVLRQRMAVAGREKAIGDFDEQRVVDRVLQAQIRALREKGRFDRFGEGFTIRAAESRDLRVLERLARADRSSRPAEVRRMASSPDGLVLVAEDEYAPFAFASGSIGAEPGEGVQSATLFALVVARAFADEGAAEALAHAFVGSMAERGAARVRVGGALADPSWQDALKAEGFAIEQSNRGDLWIRRV